VTVSDKRDLKLINRTTKLAVNAPFFVRDSEITSETVHHVKTQFLNKLKLSFEFSNKILRESNCEENMIRKSKLWFTATLMCIATAGLVSAQGAKQSGLNVPVTYYKLAERTEGGPVAETSAPLTTVAVYYNIGFRIEPRDRTGFAHLFEHLMFQGSKNLGKMEFIKLVESNGGVLNGSTRFDFTNYFAVMPSHKTETLIWAEADRMRGLDINIDNLKNQQGVRRQRGEGQRAQPAVWFPSRGSICRWQLSPIGITRTIFTAI
jgi:hypothetical protein